MLLRASKIFYVLIVMYYGWFQVVFSPIPNMLLLLGLGMIGFIILHALQNRKNLFESLTVELMLWVLFAYTSLLFGLLVAVNYGNLSRSIITFCEFIFLMFGIVYISNQDRNINFFINVFIFFAIICAVTAIFWGVDTGQGRIGLGAGDNPNALGFTMALGLGCVLYKLNFEKLGYSIVAFSAILLLIYVSLLTGSRKSFISIGLLVTYWSLFVAFKDIIALRFTAKVKGILSLLFVIGAAYYVLVPYFTDSVLLARLTGLFESGSEGGIREGMYVEAFRLFKKSPLVGVGLNNFRDVSIFHAYSHSTYAEALACTGIIGCITYFSSYILLLLHYGKMATSKLDALLLKQTRIMLGLFGVMLFLGVGVIHFYSMTSSIAFGMLIAFYNINNKTFKKGKVKASC